MEIKNCPFCDSEIDDLVADDPQGFCRGYNHGAETFHIGCSTCDMMGPAGATIEEAIERWNLRAQPSHMGLSLNSNTYQAYPERILHAADEILFQFESYLVNKTPWPILKELAAIIKKWEPFLLTTESVTLSMERYNELIEKEDKFDHRGCIAVSTDGTLIKDYTIADPSADIK